MEDCGMSAAPDSPQAASAPAPTGRCVVLFGNKGGVGKTVVAANLAVALAQTTKKPVCLLDLDLLSMGDLGKMFGLTVQRSLADLVPALKRQTPPDRLGFNEVSLVHSSDVHLFQGLVNPRQAAALEPAALGQLIQLLKSRYEFVIIDGGKAFTVQLIAAFDTCHPILLVATPDVVAMYQTKWAMGIIESLLFPA